MRYLYLLLLTISFNLVTYAQNFRVFDDFEGNGTIFNWFGDDCDYSVNLLNPFIQGINTSETVFAYNDLGGLYSNVRFTLSENLNLSQHHIFTLKIYIPSSSITGNQNNQISLKLQNSTLGQPWTTQTEIIKDVTLDEWQELTFDFLNDTYLNFDPNSLPPNQRTDLNRILIQVNGENNNDLVTAYIDDFNYNGWIGSCSPYTKLVWSDEFETDGPIDNSKWFHQTQLPNGTSWYNGELQHYTNRIENSYVENGHLYIVAKNETFTDQGVTKEYTSARLNSKIAFTNGRVEVRAQLPFGGGTWPAIWMLGKNIDEPGAYWATQGFGTTNWPQCGEIDIMEHWGDNQEYVQSAMHTPSSFGNTINKGGETGNDVSNTFHVYAAEWTPTEIRFYYDNYNVYTYAPTPQDMNTWPFVDEQYLLLNIAITNTIQANFTESPMIIDYVRVYQEGNSIDSHEACEEFTWIDGNTYTASTNTPTINLTDQFGCDSTVQLDLIIGSINASINQIDSVTLTAESGGVNYQWVDCSNGYQPVIGETSQSLIGIPGTSYAVIINDGNCTDTSECITLASVGIENQSSVLKVYPNPSSETLFIESSLVGSNYRLLDMRGKVIVEGVIRKNKTAINLNKTEGAMYIFQLENNLVPIMINK